MVSVIAFTAMGGARLDITLLPGLQRRQSGQPEARNQVLGIAGQGLEQVPALLPRGRQERADYREVLGTSLGAEAAVIVDFRQGTDHIDVHNYQNLYFATPGVDFVGRDAIEVSQKTQVGNHFEGHKTVIDIAFSPGPIVPGEHYDYHGPVAQIELLGHINLKASGFILT